MLTVKKLFATTDQKIRWTKQKSNLLQGGCTRGDFFVRGGISLQSASVISTFFSEMTVISL